MLICSTSVMLILITQPSVVLCLHHTVIFFIFATHEKSVGNIKYSAPYQTFP